MKENLHRLAEQLITAHSKYQLQGTRFDGSIEVSNWYDIKDALEPISEEVELLGIYDKITTNTTLASKAGLEIPAVMETYTINGLEEALNEAFTTNAIEKAGNIILKYIRRITGNAKIFTSLGLEHFKNSKGQGFGLRFFAPGKKIESWRFNWSSLGGADYHNMDSIDVWIGKNQGPDYHIAFESQISVIQILPQFVDMLIKGKVTPGKFMTVISDISLKESLDVGFQINEAAKPTEAYDGVISILTSTNFTKNKVWSVWKSMGLKIFDALELEYPSLIQKSGRGYMWNGTAKDVKLLQAEKDRILHQLGSQTATISSGSAKETYRYDKEIDALESQAERLTFVKQLADLENLIKLTISGASNALFIAGRGGVGKTHTVEEVLKSAGLVDGTGYFKNTGTASAAGMYTLLFKYQDQIILFDDSDDALKDSESRNLIKAATDTKPIRKLVWNKMGKNVIEPENYEGTHEEMIDEGKIPRYFNFTGKIIFISNLSIDRLDPDGAIRTRAFLIDINPTDVEVYDFMEMIVEKMPLDGDLFLDAKQRKSVVGLLRGSKSKQTANLRKLSRALNMFAGTLKAGVSISDNELTRMISTYA